MLYKIPDLSEKFIIFNDDTFLMRLTKPSDFFYNDFPVLRGKWEKYYENQKLRIFYHKIIKKINKKFKVKSGGFKTFQQTSAKLAGTKNYLRRFHTPVSVRKSTLNNFFKNNNILSDNIKFRFRGKKQFIISSLSEHLEIKNSTFKYRKNRQLTYFRSYKNKYFTIIKLWLFSVNKKKLFMTFIFFLFAILADLRVGSIPKLGILNLLNIFNKYPSLEAISIIKVFLFSLYFFINFFTNNLHCST